MFEDMSDWVQLMLMYCVFEYARVYMSSLTFIYYDYEEGRKIKR